MCLPVRRIGRHEFATLRTTNSSPGRALKITSARRASRRSRHHDLRRLAAFGELAIAALLQRQRLARKSR